MHIYVLYMYNFSSFVIKACAVSTKPGCPNHSHKSKNGLHAWHEVPCAPDSWPGDEDYFLTLFGAHSIEGCAVATWFSQISSHDVVASRSTILRNASFLQDNTLSSRATLFIPTRSCLNVSRLFKSRDGENVDANSARYPRRTWSCEPLNTRYSSTWLRDMTLGEYLRDDSQVLMLHHGWHQTRPRVNGEDETIRRRCAWF